MGSILEPLVTFPQVLIVPTAESTLGYMKQTASKTDFAARLNQLCTEHGLPEKFDGRQVQLAQIFGVSQKGARK